VPYSLGVGQLQKATNSKVGAEANFAVSAVNYEYLDSGLIGAFVVSDAATAGKVVGARRVLKQKLCFGPRKAHPKLFSEGFLNV
jgi:hypothetical protein